MIPFPQKNTEVIDSLIEESKTTMFSSETKVGAITMSFKQKEPSVYVILVVFIILDKRR